MNSRTSQFVCTWAGPFGFLFFFLGMIPFANWVPPPSPSLSSAAVQALYQNNPVGIRIGMILVCWGATLIAAWYAQVAVLMKRMEGEHTPWLYTQIISTTILTANFVLGAMILAVAAFRPERAAEITHALHDYGWLVLVWPGMPVTVGTAAMGFAIIGDRNPEAPVLPRWSGFFCVWCAVLQFGGNLVCMFHTGPFAWDGLLAYWVALTAFTAWIYVMSFVMHRSLKHDAAAALS